MPHPTLATRLFDELAQGLALRNSGSQFGKTQDALSNPTNERTRALEPNVGALLYLISLSAVAIATVVVFFGLGFLLLARPNEGLIANPDARNRGVAIEAQPSNLAPSPDEDGASSGTQTASTSSVSPAQPERHYGVLPPASKDTAPDSAIVADTGVAKATIGASPGQDVPELGANLHPVREAPVFPGAKGSVSFGQQ